MSSAPRPESGSDDRDGGALPKSSREYDVRWDQPITLPSLTERLHQDGLGADVLADILHDRDRELVDALCGPKYRPRPDGRRRRAGTKKRTLLTRLGRLTITTTRVLDLDTGRSLVPLWNDVVIQPRRVIQDDVSCLGVHMAERMSYRNTAEELARCTNASPSPHTLNRRAIQNGEGLAHELGQRDARATVIQADGTKLHAQDAKDHHDVNITVVSTPGQRPRLRILTVGKPWDDHAKAIQRVTFENDNGEPVHPTLVTDLERGLADLLTPAGGSWQPCLVHVVRNTSYQLWQDGLSKTEEKDAIVTTVVRVLDHLKNSVDHHLPKGEKDAVEHRIKQTAKEFRRLATRLWDQGLRRTSRFLRRVSNEVTTFATLALQGVVVPWHNNYLERIMGEVSKRCKHKWMSWTARGGQALLVLLVTRTVEPDTHAEFWRRKLYGHHAALPDLGVRITRLGSGC